MADVEVHWPADLDPAPLKDAVSVLDEAGLETELFAQPVRRGIPVEVLVLVASAAGQAFLKTMFDRFGADAYDGVRRFVGKLLARARGDAPEEDSGPTAVVFESRDTHAQFVFTRDLPASAYKAALSVDPGASPGRWVWSHKTDQWVRFEDVPG